MSGYSLNDRILDWGIERGIYSYDPAKDALMDGRTPGEVIVAAGGNADNNMSINDALWRLATTPEAMFESVFWIDAANSEVGEQVAINYGTGGTALNAQYGNQAISDVYDPILLPHTGDNYVYLPGTATDYLEGPGDAVFNQPAQIVMDFTPLDLSADFPLLSKNGTYGNRQFDVRVSSPTQVLFRWFDSLGQAVDQTFTLDDMASFAVGSRYVLTLDFEWSSGQPQTVTGSVSGGPVVTAPETGGETVNATTSPLKPFGRDNADSAEIYGHSCSVTAFTGEVFEFSGLDITDAGATSFTATSGQTVTVNRATSGLKSVLVTRPIWLLAGMAFYVDDDDLIDFDASDSFSVLTVFRRWGSNANGRILFKFDAGGYYTTASATGTSNQFVISDGTTFVSRSAVNTSGNLTTFIGVRDVVDDDLIAYDDTQATAPIADTTTGDLTTTSQLLIGSQGGAALAYEGELIAVAIWRRELTAAEVADISSYYGSGQFLSTESGDALTTPNFNLIVES